MSVHPPLARSQSTIMHQPNDLSHATAFAQIDDESVLAITGPDATRFLQGQLTCDVATLKPGTSTLGARCNPKGRMQSSFRLIKLSEEDYLLALPDELLEAQQQDLARYAAFFKVQLEVRNEHWLRLGLWGSDTSEVLATINLTADTTSPETGLAMTVAPATFEIWLPREQAAADITALAADASTASLNDWHLQLIRLGIGQVREPTRESFIPQMLNLQQLGGVSFKKGCYTGQEIVARMQYLGKLKRRMYRLLWEGEQVPSPGTPILNASNGQTVGEVVIAARAARQIELLAVLQTDAAELPSLIMHNSSEPLLTLATLPYEPQMAADAAEE